MDYLTTSEIAEKWGISRRRVNVLCDEGRILGAIQKGKIWLIPSNTLRPSDARVKSGKYIKEHLKENNI